MSSQAPGQVIGTAGGGLTGATWAANQTVARIGQGGEERTAAILNKLAVRPGGPTVIHDVMIPGVKANIDHIVVSGRTVTFIDTKVWTPGFYWTLSGTTRRGLSKFPPADKRTMPLALSKIDAYLQQRGVNAHLATPILAVWPSNRNGTSSFWLLRSPGARVLGIETFTRRLAHLVGTRPADASVVAAFIPLLHR